MSLTTPPTKPARTCLWRQYSLRFYSLETGLLSEVRLSAMAITASIPTTSAARPQPDILGASTSFGSGVLVGVGEAPGTGVGVGMATAATLTVTLAVLLPRNASLA